MKYKINIGTINSIHRLLQITNERSYLITCDPGSVIKLRAVFSKIEKP